MIQNSDLIQFGTAIINIVTVFAAGILVSQVRTLSKQLEDVIPVLEWLKFNVTRLLLKNGMEGEEPPK